MILITNQTMTPFYFRVRLEEQVDEVAKMYYGVGLRGDGPQGVPRFPLHSKRATEACLRVVEDLAGAEWRWEAVYG